MLLMVPFILTVPVSANEVLIPIEIMDDQPEDQSKASDAETSETEKNIDDLYGLIDFGVYSVWFGFGSVAGILIIRSMLP